MHGRHEGKKLRGVAERKQSWLRIQYIKVFNYEFEKAGGVVNVKDKSFRVFFVLVSVF